MQLRNGSKYLKQYQVDYIKDNHGTLTAKQMAGAIGCSQTTVYDYCNKMNIKPKKSFFQLTVPVIPECIKY